MTYGELIHNKIVVDKLAQKGVTAVNDISECLGKKVIVRSHGAGKDFFDKANALGIEVIDATCPFVKKFTI